MTPSTHPPAALVQPHVLVVDDDPTIRDLVSDYLGKNELRVTAVSDGAGMRGVLKDQVVDLLVLDLGLRGEDGLAIARRMRDESEIPMVMLTGRAEEADRVMGLELGADDYITKPFSPRELLARIRAVLRRKAPEALDTVVEIGALKLDPSTRRVTRGEREVRVGPTEFRLLHFFMTHPERIYSRAQLLDQVWGDHVFIEERTVDVHIRRLRKSLNEGGHADVIRTVRSAGYSLDAER